MLDQLVTYWHSSAQERSVREREREMLEEREGKGMREVDEWRGCERRE